MVYCGNLLAKDNVSAFLEFQADRQMYFQALIAVFLFTSGVSIAYGESPPAGGAPALFPVCIDGKYGFIDVQGRLVIAPQFKYAGDFTDDGLALIDREPADPGRSGVGYVDGIGRVVFRTKFLAGDFHSGRAAFYDIPYGRPFRKIRIGYLDREGRVAIPPTYSDGREFERGVALVGKPTLLSKYCEFVTGESEGHCEYTYIDRSGKQLGDDGFNADGFIARDTLLPVKNSRKYGYVGLTGEFVIAPQYDDAKPFSDGRGAVKRGELYGFIDIEGRLVIEHRYFFTQHFSEGLACVGLPDAPAAKRFGVIDADGNWIIPPTFYHIDSFSDGLAVIQVDDAHGKYGYIDRSGRNVIEPSFDRAYRFENGLAKVEVIDAVGCKVGYINPRGEYVWKPSM